MFSLKFHLHPFCRVQTKYSCLLFVCTVSILYLYELYLCQTFSLKFISSIGLCFAHLFFPHSHTIYSLYSTWTSSQSVYIYSHELETSDEKSRECELASPLRVYFKTCVFNVSNIKLHFVKTVEQLCKT